MNENGVAERTSYEARFSRLAGRRSRAASPAHSRRRASPCAQSPGALPPEFRGLAQLAAGICGTPSAAVVLNGCGEARVGDPAPHAGLPERDPFYEHVAAAAEVFEVRDAGRDQRFAAAGAPRAASAVRGYAACALRADAGEVLGTLAVYDIKPRRFSKRQLAMLASLAQQCAVQAALRARVAELEILNPPPAAPSAARDGPAARRLAARQRAGRHLLRGLLEHPDLRQSRIPAHVRILAAAEPGGLGARRASGGSRASRDHVGGFLPQSAADDASNIAHSLARAPFASMPSVSSPRSAARDSSAPSATSPSSSTRAASCAGPRR